MSGRWIALAAVNRFLAFAVPAFLFISAYGNTLSLSAKPDLRAFYTRRLRSAGVPFLLCSIAGVVATAWQSHTVPTLRHAIRLITTGHGYYHLYFMILLMELYLALPALLRIARRLPSSPALLVFAVAAESLVYAAHRFVPELGSLSRSLAWCIVPVLLGVWRAQNRAEPGDRPALGASLFAAACGYVFIGTASLAHPVNTALYQFLEWIYGAAASWGLAGICMRWSGAAAALQPNPTNAMQRGLAMLGRRSFAIYLVHPFVLQAAIAGTARFGNLPGAVQAILWTAAAVAVPVMAATAFERGMARKKANTGGRGSARRREPSPGSGTALARS